MTSRARHHKLRTIIFLVIIGIIVAVFVPPTLRVWDVFGVKHPNLAYITDYTEIAFPPSSRLVGSHSLGGPDRSITAVIKMKRRDVSPFILKLHKTTESEECKGKHLWVPSNGDSPRWWDLDSAKNVRRFESKPRHPKSPDTRCTILVREDDPNYAFIYLSGLLR
jgi:hypothetical protein